MYSDIPASSRTKDRFACGLLVPENGIETSIACTRISPHQTRRRWYEPSLPLNVVSLRSTSGITYTGSGFGACLLRGFLSGTNSSSWSLTSTSIWLRLRFLFLAFLLVFGPCLACSCDISSAIVDGSNSMDSLSTTWIFAADTISRLWESMEEFSVSRKEVACVLVKIMFLEFDSLVLRRKVTPALIWTIKWVLCKRRWRKPLRVESMRLRSRPFCRLCLIHAGIVGAANFLDRRFQSQLFLTCLYKHLSSIHCNNTFHLPTTWAGLGMSNASARCYWRLLFQIQEVYE